MVFSISSHHVVVKASLMSGKNKQQMKSLKANIQRIEDKLETNVSLALQTCNPKYGIKHTKNTECAVLWCEIEEMSNTLHNLKNKVRCLNEDADDDDCWDSIECRIYDI